MEAGFSLVGFTDAKIPESDKQNFSTWISEKRYGTMEWFAKPTAIEIRNSFLHLGFLPKTAITLGFVYRSKEGENLVSSMSKKISRYALGDDYHLILRTKGKKIIKDLKSKFGESNFRQSVDSLPISEKVLARESGIGWMGKHTNLIHKELGSYFFLSVILTDLEFEFPRAQKTDHCGSCTRCLDACPTNALAPYQIDANKCISYQTIEDRNRPELQNKEKHSWVYGCDICQEVCPWNKVVAVKKSIETLETQFLPRKFWEDHNFLNQESFTGHEFDTLFKDSAIQRIGVDVWNRNWV